MALSNMGIGYSPSPPPHVVWNLKSLTSLDLRTKNQSLGPSSSIWSRISRLTQLRTLTMSFFGCAQCLLDDGQSDSAGALEHSAAPRLRPLAEAFPFLTELYVHDKILSSAWVEECLGQLPKTLTRFSLAQDLPWSCLSYIQDHNIAYLSLALPINVPGDARLPSSITSFHNASPLHLGHNCQLWSMAPHLTELDPIESIRGPLSAFPSSLEKLRIHVSKTFDASAASDIFRHLPHPTHFSGAFDPVKLPPSLA